MSAMPVDDSASDLASPVGDARYAAHLLYGEIGESGQRRLVASSVLLVGCGALGCTLAGTLVRAGVGRVRICDRDFIELSNLQRQFLFDEQDISEGLPKAEAAARKLRRVNSSVTIEGVVTDVVPGNIERLAEGADLILDGTDNFETRYLLNDLAFKSGVPWVYGGAIGASGLVMAFLPDETPCLRCVFEEAPAAELTPTCDTVGVLAPAVQIVASLQAMEAMKILAGRRDALHRRLIKIDAWSGRFTSINMLSARRPDCPCCGRRAFEYLQGRRSPFTTTLCGRNAVQIHPPTELGHGATTASAPTEREFDLERIAAKLRPVAERSLRVNRYMLRATVEECELTLFPDGRAIIKGTDSPERARSLYARYIGA